MRHRKSQIPAFMGVFYPDLKTGKISANQNANYLLKMMTKVTFDNKIHICLNIFEKRF